VDLTENLVDWRDGNPIQVKAMASGSFHSLFLTEDGRVFGCGKNSKGQLGLSDKKVHKLSEIKMPEKDLKVESIHCGSLFSMARCKNLME